jgi:hypothetical protein
MIALIGLLAVVCGIGSLVCLILVIVKMFQKGDTTMGIVCIVTTVLCGIGALITFVYGWMKSGEWDTKNIMLAWTGSIVLGVLLQVALMVMGGAGAPMPGG